MREMDGREQMGVAISPYSYEWFVRAELLAASGDDEGAANAYERATSSGEPDALVLARWASTLDRLGQHETADDIIEAALRVEPQSQPALLELGRILTSRGQTENARRAYARAVDATPDSEAPTLALAQLLRDQGALARADALLSTFTQGHDALAAARARLAIATEREDNASAADALAMMANNDAPLAELHGPITQALEHGRAHLALRLVTTLPPRARERAGHLHVRALIETDQLTEAQNVLFALPPPLPGERLDRVALLLRAARYGEAEELAQELSGHIPEARVLHARALMARARDGEAARLLAQATSGTRQFTNSRMHLATLLERNGERRDALLLLARSGDGDDILRLRAEMLIRADNTREALQVLRECQHATCRMLETQLTP